MSKFYLSKALRKKIAEHSRYRCSYCLTRQKFVGAVLEVDHIIPRSKGGLYEEANLCLCCSFCNEYKGNQLTALDPITNQTVQIFNPLQQVWREHFEWSEEKDRIVGKTPIGRATVIALKLNWQELVETRREWITVGWHPPVD